MNVTRENYVNSTTRKGRHRHVRTTHEAARTLWVRYIKWVMGDDNTRGFRRT